MPDDHANDGPNGEGTPESIAHYIGSMAEELSQLASQHGLETLSHLLEMVRLEADQITGG